MNAIRVSAILGATGVAIGAFGAHLLPDWLAASGLDDMVVTRRLEAFETGVRYQLYHALALLSVGVLSLSHAHPRLRLSGWCFILGVLIFSGCLYLLTLTGISWLGAIVPVGGVLMIGGWICLASISVGVGPKA